jgi:hypothetical protein
MLLLQLKRGYRQAYDKYAAAEALLNPPQELEPSATSSPRYFDCGCASVNTKLACESELMEH